MQDIPYYSRNYVTMQIVIMTLYYCCCTKGYPTELLPMMVSGVPSMHICLDFIPELLAQPQTEKQVCNLLQVYFLFWP